MDGKTFRGCLLVLLACPVLAMAEPIYSAMNDEGDIVGNTVAGVGQMAGALTCEEADALWTGYAFLYRDGAFVDPGSPGGWDSLPYEIKDDQHILGKACRDGDCLSVQPDPVSAVPEPGSYALLTAGLVLLAGWRSSGRRESLRFS
ncbi:PEP-CTERM sorting domain-containing protein [Massilia alkalitolerans]|uniref:PEP-CTERM sorting domain-containing protein n=1 Tax=Massilia alkalitolerans TaxID=286638 RepID=UPI0003FCEBB2|nr:PEP-CTERM sorting domain-containing protein [Massilia alkalitolerans]